MGVEEEGSRSDVGVIVPVRRDECFRKGEVISQSGKSALSSTASPYSLLPQSTQLSSQNGHV